MRPTPRAAAPIMAVIAALALAVPAAAQLDVVDPDRGFARVARSYASLDATFARVGRITRTARVRTVGLGDGKRAVFRALGRAVSANADGSWNYDLSLDYPGTNRLVCQYRVQFDDDGRVTETVWRRPQCADVIRPGGG